MATQQITKEDMEKVANDFATTAESLVGDAQAMLTSLEPMQQDLIGAAGTTFQNIKQTVHEQMEIINRNLDDCALAIRTTGRDFDASDQESDASLQQAWGDAGDASTQLSTGQ